MQHSLRRPYWLETRFATLCRGCGESIQQGEPALCVPAEHAMYCGDTDCGTQYSIDAGVAIQAETEAADMLGAF